jgi:methylmalonyl-CoA mutase C-terminal domain/subunit
VATKKRIIMAKLGLDAHDNGIRIVSNWLANDGYEVIYAGVYNSAERVIRQAIEEDADAIGLSFLGGEHLHYVEKVLALLGKNEMGHIKVFAGGIIPPADVLTLKKMGVTRVFTPGTRRKKILDAVAESFGIARGESDGR